MNRVKRCPDCGKIKPLGEFSGNRDKLDGVQTYCKECCAEQRREGRSGPAK